MLLIATSLNASDLRTTNSAIEEYEKKRWIPKWHKTSKHKIGRSLTKYKNWISYWENVLIGWNLHAYYP